ncbi:MAG: mRNA surveillance protein Pelota, partial [Euryarchaeota archaeon]|nr:mRNA surveillance protein Pelota [Euryarchaeota archaeon]
VIAGPGFVKNEFFDLLKEKYLEIASKTSVETVSAVGTAGVQEAIKRGIIDRVVKETRVAKETTLVERVFEEIGKDSNLATYGFEAVETAANYGAIETLLVADEFLRKARFEKAIDIDSILETARKARGAIIIVSTEHESGKKLLALGGIAALLRYPLKIEH